MGMDVWGKNPTTETGKYFRNNVWWWRPLADYLVSHYPKATEPCEYWHSNDGGSLNAEQAISLANLIDADLESGVVKAYAEAYETARAALPPEPCNICGATGLRTDEIGQERGWDKPRDPETGEGGCNGCAGTGSVAHWQSHYPFSVGNVREFSQFARESGGFEIW